MKHFDITRWADYVRGLTPASTAATMSEHLGSGCRRCESLVATLQRIALAARSEGRHAPPTPAVRIVKAIYGLQRRERQTLLDRVGLRLKYDSAPAAALSGLRNGAVEGASRHLLLESGRYCLDVRMARGESHGDSVMEGYLRRQDGRPLAEAPLFLVSGDEIALRGSTGEFGEFFFGRVPNAPLELWVLGDEVEPIGADLPAW